MKYDLHAKFAPFGDGRGHAVEVRITREDASNSTITIEGWQWDAKNWPEVKAGIDALLAAIPNEGGVP